VGRVAVDRQVRQHFAHQCGEFEAVAGAACPDNDLGIFGVLINDKLLVGGQGVEAAARGD